MEQTTIVKKILYLTAILLSLAMIWYFIWSWIMIVNIANDYPGYAFEKNVGYGTKEHLEGLKKYGITPIHRKTFEPIKSMLKEP